MFTVRVVGSFDLKDGNINFKAANIVYRQKSILEISKILSRSYKTPMRELPRLILYIAAYLDKRFSLRLARASANLHYEFRSNRPTELLGIDLRNTEESILEAAETMVEKGWVKQRS